MSVANAVATGAQVSGLVLAPLAAGAVQQIKGRLQGRRGPSPVQPYRELRRLWGKSGVQPQTAGPVYALAPAITAACVLLALLIVPIGGRSGSWGIGNDVLVLVGLLGLARFAVTASAWDTGSGFALMGAGRDLTFAVVAEGTLVLVVLLAALPAGGSTDLVAMSAAAAGSAPWGEPSHWCAAAAFVFVALTESGRQPIDNPDTHLELTMVHEGPLLEYAGRDLALLQWAAAARLWVMMVLAAELFAPKDGGFWAQLAVTLGGVPLLCVAVAVTETWLAKMRILRVPLVLAGAAALCLAGLGAWAAGGGVA